MNLSTDDMVTIITIISGVILLVLYRFPEYKKQLKIGMLLLSFIRDINALLIKKMTTEWNNLSVLDKVNILTQVYELINNYSDKDLDENEPTIASEIYDPEVK